MEQVLFHIPISTPWFPDGIPIYGFGLMLFLCFLVCTTLAAKRAERQGIPGDKVHDVALVLFIGGLVGARIVYMIQYHVSIWDFFKIWEGGIVFYGSAIGGWCAYWVFYWVVLRKFNISTWVLADAIAPALALGLAMGRIGCFLNGCCYGHLACDDCAAVHFPLLTSPVAEEVVFRDGLQTRTGFIAKDRDTISDPRTVIAFIEPGSEAAAAGLQVGDRITAINGKPNQPTLLITDELGTIRTLQSKYQQAGFGAEPYGPKFENRQMLRVLFPDLASYQATLTELRSQGMLVQASDTLTVMLSNWPRGQKSLTLSVDRAGGEIPLAKFTPRTLGVHPTQLYETVSMTLLFLLMIAYFPFRRHNGQLFTMLMVCYAVHRFINEQLRNDTAPVIFDLTLSQALSIVILFCGIGLELVLIATQDNRWKRPKPGTIADTTTPATPAV